ncbi:unnamed protein product [Ectocarpus fasciculatus]
MNPLHKTRDSGKNTHSLFHEIAKTRGSGTKTHCPSHEIAKTGGSGKKTHLILPLMKSLRQRALHTSRSFLSRETIKSDLQLDTHCTTKSVQNRQQTPTETLDLLALQTVLSSRLTEGQATPKLHLQGVKKTSLPNGRASRRWGNVEWWTAVLKPREQPRTQASARDGEMAPPLYRIPNLHRSTTKGVHGLPHRIPYRIPQETERWHPLYTEFQSPIVPQTKGVHGLPHRIPYRIPQETERWHPLYTEFQSSIVQQTNCASTKDVGWGNISSTYLSGLFRAHLVMEQSNCERLSRGGASLQLLRYTVRYTVR